jgi:hypothetical protein
MHCPETAVSLFYPPAQAGFLDWVKNYPQVRLHTAGLKTGCGWNVKPLAVMRLIEDGFEEVIWIDSDVLVNRDVIADFSHLGRDIFVVSEHTLGAKERYDGNALRAVSWGLPVGRILPSALCSGVFRATPEHYHLMERWWELLQTKEYREFQGKDWGQRPFHMLGDQDVLTALLTSKEFSQIPMQVLRRGKDIIQFDGVWGYTVTERIGNLMGDGPGFVHSAAAKPWSERWLVEPPTLKEYVKKLYLDLSPYTLLARQFRSELGCDTEWMEPHYRLSRVLRVLGMGHLALVGLPMALFLDVGRLADWGLKSRNQDAPHVSLLEPKEREAVSKG